MERMPMLPEYDVVPLPVPKSPANIHPIPSTPIPRLMAWEGGCLTPIEINSKKTLENVQTGTVHSDQGYQEFIGFNGSYQSA